MNKVEHLASQRDHWRPLSGYLSNVMSKGHGYFSSSLVCQLLKKTSGSHGLSKCLTLFTSYLFTSSFKVQYSQFVSSCAVSGCPHLTGNSFFFWFSWADKPKQYGESSKELKSALLILSWLVCNKDYWLMFPLTLMSFSVDTKVALARYSMFTENISRYWKHMFMQSIYVYKNTS